MVLRGRAPWDAEDDMRWKYVIQVRDAISGELTSQWLTQCQHEDYSYSHTLATWNTNNTTYLAHACRECQAVHLYNISTGQLMMSYKPQGVNPVSICRGPGPNTLLLVDRNNKRIEQLQLIGNTLQVINQITPEYKGADLTYWDNISVICYSNLHDCIYLAGDKSLTCISWSGEAQWKLGGWYVDVGGEQLDELQSICCDPAGRLYITGETSDRILVVAGDTGELLHVEGELPG